MLRVVLLRAKNRSYLCSIDAILIGAYFGLTTGSIN